MYTKYFDGYAVAVHVCMIQGIYSRSTCMNVFHNFSGSRNISYLEAIGFVFLSSIGIHVAGGTRSEVSSYNSIRSGHEQRRLAVPQELVASKRN